MLTALVVILATLFVTSCQPTTAWSRVVSRYISLHGITCVYSQMVTYFQGRPVLRHDN